MTEAVATTTSRKAPRPGGRLLSDGRSLYWWAEVLGILAFYLIYSAVRNANQGSATEAFAHARSIIHLERWIGLYHEETLQDWALGFRPIVIACNYFYGSMHFVVSIGAAVFLYRRFPNDYPRLRNTLALATALALVGFVGFALMPPRLLPESFGFTDTLAKYPTFWSFNSGAMSKVSNQYAAMPSVHIAWATWCTLVFAPRVRSRGAKALAILYPFLTLVVIVLTANHYLLDAVGGVAILAFGYVGAHLITRAGRGSSVPLIL
jgi:hypothetical protein